MKDAWFRLSLGVVLAGGISTAAICAEEGIKPLPTLLIKGEVVSLDANDPAATLLKVKDRYGFETPIFVTKDTKVTQGESALPLTNLAAGTPVEVEYNFDVNTAKRHAVSVKVSGQTSTETASTSAATRSAAAAGTTAGAATPASTTQQPAAPQASGNAAASQTTTPATKQ